MYYVKFRIWITGGLCYPLKYNVDAQNIKWKVISRSKETKMKENREALLKV